MLGKERSAHRLSDRILEKVPQGRNEGSRQIVPDEEVEPLVGNIQVETMSFRVSS